MNSISKKSSLKLDLPHKQIEQLVDTALNEDIRSADITTSSIIPASMRSRASWRAKQDGTVAGLFMGEKVFHALQSDIDWQPMVEEGQTVQQGDILVKIEGNTRALLTGERTALNFVQRMSGVATKTSQFVRQLKDTATQILDTRKTLPGFRALDKYAVKTGGGTNHRMGLFDMALIKENHITAAGNITNAVKQVQSSGHDVRIEVETTNLQEVKEAGDAGADMILLDNMDPEEMAQAVDLVNRRAQTEASGNVTFSRLQAIAACGVDYISSGALTHSVKAFDISQIIE